LATACALLVAVAAGCGEGDDGADDGLAGRIVVVGAQTAYPFAQAAADQFQIEHPDLTIMVDRVPPAAAFDRLCAGAAALVASPRRISPRERRECADREAVTQMRALPSDGAGQPLYAYGGRASGAAEAFEGFVGAHHELIAQAAEGGRRALSR